MNEYKITRIILNIQIVKILRQYTLRLYFFVFCGKKSLSVGENGLNASFQEGVYPTLLLFLFSSSHFAYPSLISCLTSPPTAYLQQQNKVADFTCLKCYKFQFTSKVAELKIVKGHQFILIMVKIQYIALLLFFVVQLFKSSHKHKSSF